MEVREIASANKHVTMSTINFILSTLYLKGPSLKTKYNINKPSGNPQSSINLRSPLLLSTVINASYRPSVLLPLQNDRRICRRVALFFGFIIA